MQSAYKLVTTWFTSLEANGQPFPSNFNFSFYLKALTISLEMTDHSIVTTRVLWHIYKTLQYLPLDYKTQVIQELLKKHFFRFFFHRRYVCTEATSHTSNHNCQNKPAFHRFHINHSLLSPGTFGYCVPSLAGPYFGHIVFSIIDTIRSITL